MCVAAKRWRACVWLTQARAYRHFGPVRSRHFAALRSRHFSKHISVAMADDGGKISQLRKRAVEGEDDGPVTKAMKAERRIILTEPGDKDIPVAVRLFFLLQETKADMAAMADEGQLVHDRLVSRAAKLTKLLTKVPSDAERAKNEAAAAPVIFCKDRT